MDAKWIGVAVVIAGAACGCSEDESNKTANVCSALSADPAGVDPRCAPDAATGQGGVGGTGGTAGTSGTGGTAGAPGGSGGMAGTGTAGMAGAAGRAGAAGTGGGEIDYCAVGECPVGLDAMLPQSGGAPVYRAESGGPYWDPLLGPPPEAMCWCVMNEVDEAPGDEVHGPFDATAHPDPTAVDSAVAWGDHFGPNCPYHHMHGTPFTPPADTAGVTAPPDPDDWPGQCGHGGLVWIRGDGSVILGP